MREEILRIIGHEPEPAETPETALANYGSAVIAARENRDRVAQQIINDSWPANASPTNSSRH
jgi:hypothetical protein